MVLNPETLSLKYFAQGGDGDAEPVSYTHLDVYKRQFLGSDDPKYSFSFNFGCEWKGYDFNTVFQGVGKRTI